MLTHRFRENNVFINQSHVIIPSWVIFLEKEDDFVFFGISFKYKDDK